MARSSSVTDLLQWGLLAAIGYGIYTVLSKLPQATKPISDAIADWWVRISAQPPMVPQGSVYFPDGAYLPVASIPGGVSWDSALNAATFSYGGQSWVVPRGHDANGNWAAVPRASFQASPGTYRSVASEVDFGIHDPTGGWS